MVGFGGCFWLLADYVVGVTLRVFMHDYGGGTCAWHGWRGHAATRMQGVATFGAVFCVLRLRSAICRGLRDGIAGSLGKYLSGD